MHGTRPAFLVLSLVLLLSGCASAHEGLRDFTSDGCSLFPDGTPGDPEKWCTCCFQHDTAYWRGGSAEERLQADEAFRSCVLMRTGSTALANVMFQGVRAGGHPVFPNWYRWGYGWDYGRGYTPLSGRERRAAAESLERYLKDHPSGYCPPHGP